MSEELESGAGGEAGESGGEKQWLSSIPENLRDNEAFTSAESLKDIYNGYAEMHAKSKDMLAIPGEDASDEDRAAFYAKLGRPEAADGYELTAPEGLPDGLYEAEAEAGFKALAHENGLTQEQAEKLHGWYWKSVADGTAAAEKATQEAIDSLKDEWKGDAFKVNTELAVRAFDKYGGEDGKSFLKDTVVNGVKLGDHPTFLKIFAGIGKDIADDTMNDGNSGGQDAFTSDEDAAKKRFPNTNFK